MPTSIDKDVSLEEREHVAEMWVMEDSYNLEVPMDGVGTMYVIHSACCSQQLTWKYQDNDWGLR